MNRLDAVVSAVAADSGLDPDRVAQDKISIFRFINETRQEIGDLPNIDFPALEFSGELVGVANVTAGTVSATQNKAEVTGAGTAWTTAMAGRMFQVAPNAWQRISFVTDTTHLTLESGWNNDTVAGASYTIWKREYELPPKVEEVEDFVDLSNPDNPIEFIPHREFINRYGMGDTFDAPRVFTQFSQTDFGQAYLASTVYTSVSVTAGSPIVDFTGTGLVTAMAPGDRLRIGDSTTATAFYINRILTDSKAVLREMVTQTVTAASATAQSLDRVNVRFYPALNNTKVYQYFGKKKVVPLINDADYIEPGWYTAVKLGATAKAFAFLRDPREQAKKAEYSVAIAALIRDQFKVKNPNPRLKPLIRDRYTYRSQFGSNRDTW